MIGIRCVIVEDELHALERLKLAVGEVEQVEVVGVARHGDKGLDLIRDLKPDLVFLDIALPGLSGIEIAAKLTVADPPVIVFVTAFEKFAVEAFRVAAVDYLLKPVDFQQVAQTIDRARQQLISRRAEDRLSDLESLIATLRADQTEADKEAGWEHDLWAPHRGGLVRVPIASVEWFQADRDYVRIYSEGGNFLMRERLHALEKRLDPQLFCRVHRSAIVNLNQISRISHRSVGALELIMASGADVPVARPFRSRLMEVLKRAESANGRSHPGEQ